MQHTVMALCPLRAIGLLRLLSVAQRTGIVFIDPLMGEHSVAIAQHIGEAYTLV